MPERLLSSIAHVELKTPDLDASVAYAHDILGLDVVEQQGGSAYLRCWGDYYRYSVVVAPGDEPSLVTAAWRTSSAEALEAAAKAVEAAGIEGEWFEGHAIGRAFRFTANLLGQ